MKKLVLYVLPLFTAVMLLSGAGQKPPVAAGGADLKAKAEACVCSKDCKVCSKDAKNCGKEGCTCMKMDGKTAVCACSKDCKVCAKDAKNCGKEGCTCMKMDMKGMKHEDMKDMKGMKHGDMKGMNKGDMKAVPKDAKASNPAKLFVRPPAKAELGKEVACPVMTNEKFKVAVSTPVIDYKGKAYFMCCKGCPEKFIANPEKYVK